MKLESDEDDSKITSIQKKKKKKRSLTKQVWDIPSPCMLFQGFQFIMKMVILVIILGYVLKAIYLMNINGTTLSQTLDHISFYYPDQIFFFVAVALLLLVYSFIIFCHVCWKCIGIARRDEQLEDYASLRNV
jgi:hypothetical protein